VDDVLPVLEDIVSFFAQAPRLKALANTATIMIAFKNFIFFLSRLLSQQVAAGLLGREKGARNDFLQFFPAATTVVRPR
jgi:hypothetical protein